MSSRISGVQYRHGIRPAAWISSELENLVYTTPRDSEDANTTATESMENKVINSTTQKQGSEEKSNYEPERTLGSFRAGIRRQDTANTADRKRKLGWEVDEKANDSASSRLARHRLFAQAIRDFPSVRDQFSQKTPESYGFVTQLHQYVVLSAVNWPTDFLLRAVDTQVVGMALWFVSIMYGSVHLAA
jgi:hypothetical protein